MSGGLARPYALRMTLPHLPEGWASQVVWSRQRGFARWEFHRVYDPDDRLDPGRCFWLWLDLTGRQPGARWVFYSDVAHKTSFAEFSSFYAAPDPVRTWLSARDRAERPRREPAHAAAQAAGPSLP